MINTDKYTGHTEGKWKLQYDDSAFDGDYLDYGAQLDPVGALEPMLIADAQLIADAPILLSEYKQLLKNINEYVDKVEAFHKMLKEEYEMKHKIPLCPEYKNNFPGAERKVWKEHNWVMDDWVGHRCVDCGFHLGKPLSPPKWKGDDE
jgi:hypothetical protein